MMMEKDGISFAKWFWVKHLFTLIANEKNISWMNQYNIDYA